MLVKSFRPVLLPSSVKGFFLIEVLVSVVIFSIGVLGLISLQAAAIRHNEQSKYRTDASYFANQIVTQMWADRPNLAAYDDAGTAPTAKTEWLTTVAAGLPAGTAAIRVVGQDVQVAVRWSSPGETNLAGKTWAHEYLAMARVSF